VDISALLFSDPDLFLDDREATDTIDTIDAEQSFRG
jgi:hypothetical protein